MNWTHSKVEGGGDKWRLVTPRNQATVATVVRLPGTQYGVYVISDEQQMVAFPTPEEASRYVQERLSYLPDIPPLPAIALAYWDAGTGD